MKQSISVTTGTEKAMFMHSLYFLWIMNGIYMKYIRNLKNGEQKATGRTNTILSVSTQTHKQGRPFLGILVLVNERKYCIPLSSVEEKEKYKSMSENITCRKIRDDDGNVIGIKVVSPARE